MDPDLDMLAELFNESGQPVAARQDADLHGSASAAGSVMTASDDAFSVDDDRSRKRARTSAAVASAGAGSSSPQMRPKVRATKSAADTCVYSVPVHRGHASMGGHHRLELTPPPSMLQAGKPAPRLLLVGGSPTTPASSAACAGLASKLTSFVRSCAMRTAAPRTTSAAYLLRQ